MSQRVDAARSGRRLEDSDCARGELRADVAAALRRARGKHPQTAWVEILAPHLGREIDATQWSKYETGRVDPPAYVLVAAARAAGAGLSALLDDPQPTPEQLMAKLNELLAHVRPSSSRG